MGTDVTFPSTLRVSRTRAVILIGFPPFPFNLEFSARPLQSRWDLTTLLHMGKDLVREPTGYNG